MTARLTITRGQWYGWTMWPGYGDQAYHSPIWVRDVRPLGKRRLDIDLFNLGYAQGVQDMTYTLQTLKREQSYIMDAVPDSDRCVAVEPLSMHWIRSHLHDADTRVEDLRREMSSPDYIIAEWLRRQTQVHLQEITD
jgi:hypothetical protein